MKRFFLLFLLMSATARALTAVSTIPWRAEYDAALAEAAQSGKPVLIDFSAAWCGPCKRMEADTFTDERIEEALKTEYVPLRVDFDRSPELVTKYHVEGIPCLVLLNRFGELIDASMGLLEPEQLIAWLAKNHPAAAASVSQAEQLRSKLDSIEAKLGSKDPAERERGIHAALESYLAHDPAASGAAASLKKLVDAHPEDLIELLNDPRLAARILAGNLLAPKLGSDFVYDPWDTAEARAAAISEWQKKAAAQPSPASP